VACACGQGRCLGGSEGPLWSKPGRKDQGPAQHQQEPGWNGRVHAGTLWCGRAEQEQVASLHAAGSVPQSPWRVPGCHSRTALYFRRPQSSCRPSQCSRAAQQVSRGDRTGQAGAGEMGAGGSRREQAGAGRSRREQAAVTIHATTKDRASSTWLVPCLISC